MNTEDLSDEDLVSLLEAVDFMVSHSASYPPLEGSRFFRSSEGLFQRLANEAVARGMTEYAAIDPEHGGIYPGEKIGETSELERLKEWCRNEWFMRNFEEIVCFLAAERDDPDLAQKDWIEQSKAMFPYRQSFEEVIDEKGIRSFITLDHLKP